MGSIIVCNQTFKYLFRLSMSRIIDTINKRTPILELIGEAKLNEYRQELKKEDHDLSSTISDFIDNFNKVSHPNTVSHTFIILNLSIY